MSVVKKFIFQNFLNQSQEDFKAVTFFSSQGFSNSIDPRFETFGGGEQLILKSLTMRRNVNEWYLSQRSTYGNKNQITEKELHFLAHGHFAKIARKCLSRFLFLISKLTSNKLE